MAQVDVDRSQVQALTQQQRVTSPQNDLAKQKINLTTPVTFKYYNVETSVCQHFVEVLTA